MTIIEISGFVFGIAGVWLTLKENIWCFPVGLVNVIFSLYLFWEQKLYSDAIQQAVYIVLLLYGWYNWLNIKDDAKKTVSTTTSKTWLALAICGTIVAVSMGSFFHYFTDADVPYLDASATTLSFVAQFLIARKKIENWLIWMVVNVVYVGIYLNKELYLYALLFTVYFVLAILGYHEWKKEMNKSST